MVLQNRDQVLRELEAALASVDVRAVEKLERLIAGTREVFCYGLGRSGLSSSSFAMRLMQLGLKCSIVGDVLAHPIQAGDLLIITSASGAGKMLEILGGKAKELGANVALITSNTDSDLAALADVTISMHTPTKSDQGAERISVTPMGSLFEEATFLLFDLITVDLMESLHICNEDMISRHANLE